MAIPPGATVYTQETNCYNGDGVWPTWTSDGPTTSTYYYDTNTVWHTWVRDTYNYTYVCESSNSITYSDAPSSVESIWHVWTDEAVRTLYEETADELLEDLQRGTEALARAIGNFPENNGEQSRYEDRYAEIQRQREKAEQKAKSLLLDLIGEKELEIYERTGRVFVRGKKHDYIVQRDGFVRQIQKDKIQDLCAHINTNVYPKTDNVIALKMLIESDEDKFLKTANPQGFRELKSLPKAACM